MITLPFFVIITFGLHRLTSDGVAFVTIDVTFKVRGMYRSYGSLVYFLCFQASQRQTSYDSPSVKKYYVGLSDLDSLVSVCGTLVRKLF